MYALGIVVAIVCFLYLSLLALLRAGRQRREQERSAYKKLPRVSQEIISTFAAQIAKTQDQEKLTRTGRDCVAEFQGEQPFLFGMIVEILKQQGHEDLQGIAPAFIVYKLLKAQMEADLLDRSLDH